MFNRKLKKEIEELRYDLGKLNGIKYEELKDGRILERIEHKGVLGEIGKMIKNIEDKTDEQESRLNRLFVDNYFTNCPCCGNQKEILKSEAVSFKDVWGHEHYTTKESYETHKSKIKEWEKIWEKI